MEDLSKIYYQEEIPYSTLIQANSLVRLQNVGMNCGLEYTSYPLFTTILPYSRFQHSLGVSLIIYHFTHDLSQSLAGLFHDIATPAFAHVIDFLHHDYLTQESTEENTKAIIQSDPMILSFLNDHKITIEEVCDYHLYPIADNDAPKLSADRLEYTLGNLVNYGFGSKEDVERIYQDLIVGENEFHEDEIMFTHPKIAYQFALLSLQCSKVYVADNDRYSMEYLARLIKEAIELEVLDEKDLYTIEPVVIQKIMSHPVLKEKWAYFQKLNSIRISNDPKEDYYCINAKKRYIDPYIYGLGRVSKIYPEYKIQMKKFLDISFDYYIKGMIK